MFCEILIEKDLFLDSKFINCFNSFANKLEKKNISVKFSMFDSNINIVKSKIETITNSTIIISSQIDLFPGDNNNITPDFFNNIISIPSNEFTLDNIDNIITNLINMDSNVLKNKNNKVENLVFQLLKNKKYKIGFCESCTGGLICSRFTKISGVSKVFDRGIITYSNESKIEEVNVSKDTLDKHGAVSKEVALEMARGLMIKAKLDISLSVTGIAGPNGGSKDKPVGLVYIGISTKEDSYVYKNVFKGNRNEIQRQTADKAFLLLMDLLKNIDQ